jgi:DNA invertase Pin-like site-specific DNA recombinase
MRIGCARVSTDVQTCDLQRDALKRAKCRQIYEERASGKNTARPQLEACLKSLRKGDTLIVWRLDRDGRRAVWRGPPDALPQRRTQSSA